MKIETAYNIDDRVEIIELSRSGQIIGIEWDGVRIAYNVRYFDNGGPHIVSFYEGEIKLVYKTGG